MTTYDDSFDTESINLAQTGSVTIVPPVLGLGASQTVTVHVFGKYVNL